MQSKSQQGERFAVDVTKDQFHSPGIFRNFNANEMSFNESFDILHERCSSYITDGATA